MDTLIRDRKVDVRCLDCGAGSAWTAWCYRCSSTNLEMVPQKALRGPYSVQGDPEEPEAASVGHVGPVMTRAFDALCEVVLLVAIGYVLVHVAVWLS